MRLRFSDLSRTKKLARRNVENGIAGVKRWWIKKYKLPPNHELFLKQTMHDLNLEMFEDWILRKKELKEMISDFGHGYSREQLSDMQHEINQLAKALGEQVEVVEDELIDKWERDIAEGRIPNLDED